MTNRIDIAKLLRNALTVCLLMIAATASAYRTDRYVVLISLDGCRWDYTQWYDTPMLDRMAAEGASSGLVPCFPSKTFPNHYSLATGLVPDHHGILANSFYDRATGRTFSLGDVTTKSDPRYWGGEPIWLTAKRQGVRTAVFYWPGSDVAVKGQYPDLYHVYDSVPRLTVAERFRGIAEQLQKPEAERPHLIMAYSEEPDKSGHHYGPQDKRTRQAMEQTDSLLADLQMRLQKLPIYSQIDFLVVSDHGMAIIKPEQQIRVSDYLRPEWYHALEGNMPAHIYCNEGKADSVYNALKDVPHLTVWRGHDADDATTKRLQYGMHEHCGDVIVSPDLGWIFYDGVVTVGGMHGFDPAYNDMQAVFRAIGPDFKNVEVPHFRNVSVYPLVCHLLGIVPSANDGSIDDVKAMLKE